LAKEYVGRVVFAKVNIDENHPHCYLFGIQSIPTT
jgi:thioredoxin-like negative regulator of GroEL